MFKIQICPNEQSIKQREQLFAYIRDKAIRNANDERYPATPANSPKPKKVLKG